MCVKLNYDRKSKDPTYFIQQEFRNGKKTSTRNIARILHPASKLKTHRHLSRYYEQTDFDYQHILQTMEKHHGTV